MDITNEVIKELQDLVISIREEMLSDSDKVGVFNRFQGDILTMLKLKIKEIRRMKNENKGNNS